MFNKMHMVLIGTLVLTLLISGCTQSVSTITSDDSYIDKTVMVRGTVESSLKLGSLSGYSLKDRQGDTILVASQKLPADGDTVTARGTLKKGLLGFYIDTN